jgi:NarL family two-component system response regulator LiaR
MINGIPIKVLSVEDHAFVAEGLRARLALEPDLQWVGRLDSAERLLPEVERLRPDVVLLDIEMPGPDVFRGVEDLRRQCPDVRVIMLSAHVRDHYIDAAVQAGAWGYISKSDPPDRIVEGIRAVVGGAFAFGPEIADRCLAARRSPRGSGDTAAGPRSRLEALTAREQEILRMIGKGMSRDEIAATIFRSGKTVDAHRTSIMTKLDIHDRVALARYAIREGLVEA